MATRLTGCFSLISTLITVIIFLHNTTLTFSDYMISRLVFAKGRPRCPYSIPAFGRFAFGLLKMLSNVIVTDRCGGTVWDCSGREVTAAAYKLSLPIFFFFRFLVFFYLFLNNIVYISV